MRERADTLQAIELYDVFPRTISGVWQPFITVAALGSPLKGQVVLHEEQVGLLESCKNTCAHRQNNHIVASLIPPAGVAQSTTDCMLFHQSFENMGKHILLLC